MNETKIVANTFSEGVLTDFARALEAEPANSENEMAARRVEGNSREVPSPRTSKCVGVPLIWALLGLLVAGWAVLRWYALRLGDGSDEPFGLVALIACAWFARGRQPGEPVSFRRLWVSSLPLAMAVFAPELPPLARAFLWLVAVGAVVARRATWAALLAYSLPFMASAQFFAGYPVRVAVTWTAAAGLRLLGLAVSAQATLLSWHHQRVLIDAPCSGLHMAWLAGLVALILANEYELSAFKSIQVLIWAGVATFVANVLRAAALFLLETQLRVSAEWMHDMIGLVLFAGLVGVVVCAAERARDGCRASGQPLDPAIEPLAGFTPHNPSFASARRWTLTLFFVLCGLWATRPWLAQHGSVSARELQGNFPGWNASPVFRALAGRAESLQQLPLDAKTRRFADDFPGQIGVFTDGRSTYIVRWINRPTRKLHSAADCLRAAGFGIEPGRAQVDRKGGLWASFKARRGAEAVLVTERIVGPDGSAWTDVSAWFWENVFRSSETSGPWWGITRLEREGS